jgi:hypothetical protein
VPKTDRAQGDGPTPSRRYAQTLALAEAEARLRKSEIKTDIPDDLKGRLEALEGRVEKEEAEKEVANLRARLQSTKVAGRRSCAHCEPARPREGARRGPQVGDRGHARQGAEDGIVIYKEGWNGDRRRSGIRRGRWEKILGTYG